MRSYVGLGSVAALLILGTTSSYAAQFASELVLGECVGTCEIAPAGSATFVTAEKGKKYAYGATLKTGRKSSIAIVLSDGNEFRLLADSLAVAVEDPSDKTFKVVKLKTGKVDVKLNPEFHKTNKFRVETATAVCAAIGCTFSVEASTTTIVTCDDGQIQLSGTGATKWTTTMDKGDAVTCATDPKGALTIKAVSGSFELTFTATNGEKKTVTVPAGTIIQATETSHGGGAAGDNDKKNGEDNGKKNGEDNGQGKSETGAPVTEITLTVTKPDGTTSTVSFMVTPSGIPPSQIQSITESFTTGVTPTQVGDR